MYGGWAVERDGPMDDFIPSEDLSGVEQLTRSAVIATQNVARLRRRLGKVSSDMPAVGPNRRPHG